MTVNRQWYREYMRNRRAKLKAEGICVDCQNTPAETGRTLCGGCLHDRRTREKAASARRRARSQQEVAA
jgi:hypothetical protein